MVSAQPRLTQDDPTEEELVGAAETLDTMMAKVQPPFNIFFTPASLGALPALWLQAKLTISLAPFQEKFAKLFQSQRNSSLLWVSFSDPQNGVLSRQFVETFVVCWIFLRTWRITAGQQG